MSSEIFVFDLDDTLIDTKLRHFTLMSDYLEKHKMKFYSVSEYLNLRKNNELSNAQIINNFFPYYKKEFDFFWSSNIESEYYLNYDIEIVSTTLLEELKKRNRNSIILLSFRTNQSSAKKQFEKFSFASLFDETFFIAHSDKNAKLNILNRLKCEADNVSFFSDTKIDLISAAKAGVQFYGVSTGIYGLSGPRIFLDINKALLNILK